MMEIRVTGKNISVTEGMQDHLQEKLSKLDRYSPKLVESHVVLEKQKYIFRAEITLLAKHLRAYGEGRSKENIYTAIDQAYVRIEKQLKKFREKVKSHYKEHGEDAVAPKIRVAQKIRQEESGPETLAPEKGTIVRTKEFAAKPMSPDEACLQMGLLDKPFLVFMNASTQKVNVIYKRDDGKYGLIEPA
ncbi:MAG: ribosome-associated translation inhibitor RaiA [Candidatus Omnitrophica bacterium]|nr:ribosome-associated translation inhibitor RaiA [Candidatus Omnitrophota bacterium]MDD5670297.1 ribosome-associated translation inhibitor RaiA [Candidatus Omnitrophota bacterium]